VGIREQVLIRAGRGLLAEGLLHHGPGRHTRRLRGVPASIRDEPAQERLAAGQPMAGRGVGGRRRAAPKRAVQLTFTQSASLPGCHLQDPELKARLTRQGECHVSAIGRPRQVGDARRPGQARNGDLAAIGELPEREPVEVASSTRTGVQRVDAQASDAQLGLRQLGDRRRAGALHHQHPASSGTHAHGGRGDGIDEIGDGLGRQPIGLL